MFCKDNVAEVEPSELEVSKVGPKWDEVGSKWEMVLGMIVGMLQYLACSDCLRFLAFILFFST